jgi:hypothetical protein
MNCVQWPQHRQPQCIRRFPATWCIHALINLIERDSYLEHIKLYMQVLSKVYYEQNPSI